MYLVWTDQKESRDTNQMYLKNIDTTIGVPWEHKPLIQICNLRYSTLYLDIITQLAIVALDLLALVGFSS